MRKRIPKLLIAALAVSIGGGFLEARTKKADKLVTEGRQAEVRKQFDRALELYERALSEDPGDAGYQLAVRRIRFDAAQAHVDAGQKLRQEGKLAEALQHFERAYAIDPSSSIAEQEVRRTREMIEQEKKRQAQPGPKAEVSPEERGLTPADAARRRTAERVASIQPVPELKPISTQPINFVMNNQSPRVLFETVGKMAGINVIFDPDYMTQGAVRNQSVEFNNTSLEEALDYLAVMTKSFWKPLSANTIFVTQDNTTKRRDYQEMVMKVYYLSNITTAQELQEVITTVRSITDIKRIFAYGSQSAIVVRGEVDQVALADKIVADLDKPRAEVVVDVLVLSVVKAKTRDLTAAIAPAGLKLPITYSPRYGTLPASSSTSGATTTATSTSSGAISLGNLGKTNEKDWTVVLPSGNIEAIMNDRDTRVLQSPRIRVADSQKATLHVGDKVPIATGSYSSGVGAASYNPLVQTQFQFQDVGVKMELTPKIHAGGEVSLHVDAETSSVKDRIDVGGVSQPIIGQTKVTHDIRIKEGEASVLGGLIQEQESKTVTGVPGLSSIPLIRRLFTSESIDKSESELLIVLIPHIVRSPDITPDNLRTVDVGTDTVTKLNYARRRPAPAEAEKAAPRPLVPQASPAAPAAAPRPAPLAGPQPGSPPPTAPPVVSATPSGPAPAAAQSRQPRFVFTPSQVNAQAGSTVSISVGAENVSDLFAASMRLKFDPRVLRLADVSAGGLLGSDGKTPAPVSKNILNDTGDATVLVRRFPVDGGVSGSGPVVTLVFQVVGSGVTNVSFPDLTLRNTQLQPLISGAGPLAVTAK
jgi:general secretion pathway protein D